MKNLKDFFEKSPELLDGFGGERLAGCGFECEEPDAEFTSVEGNMRSKRNRKPLPPSGERPWLLLVEAAGQIGCSSATIHRLRRGEIDGVPRLPAVQVGKRKWIVLKESLERWQQENEQVSVA